MDFSKYRTRFPPKEHEEAVRMLLEGFEPTNETSATPMQPRAKSNGDPRDVGHRRIARPFGAQTSAKQVPLADSESRREHSVGQQQLATANQVDSAGSSYDQSDELGLDESNSSLQDVPLDARDQPAKPKIQAVPQMRSKATSTTSDSMSISTGSSSNAGAAVNFSPGALLNQNDANNNNDHYESIPNRTIAVQCDLKASSVKRDGYFDTVTHDMANMQASSISATRYGFYKLTAETMGQRRKLARSISSRNIAESADGSSKSPASISEMSSSHSNSDEPIDCDELIETRNELCAPRMAAKCTSGNTITSNNRVKSSIMSRQHGRPSREPLQLRRDASLPRRPKTALSYVSASCLKEADARSESSSHDDFSLDSDRASRLMRGRAISQLVLTGPRTPMELEDDFEPSSSASASSTGDNRAPNQRHARSIRCASSRAPAQGVRSPTKLTAPDSDDYHMRRQNGPRRQTGARQLELNPSDSENETPVDCKVASQIRPGRLNQDPLNEESCASELGAVNSKPLQSNEPTFKRANDLKRSATINRLHRPSAYEHEIRMPRFEPVKYRRNHLNHSHQQHHLGEHWSRNNGRREQQVEQDEHDREHELALNRLTGIREANRIPNEQTVRYNSMSLSRRPLIECDCNLVSTSPNCQLMNRGKPELADGPTGGGGHQDASGGGGALRRVSPASNCLQSQQDTQQTRQQPQQFYRSRATCFESPAARARKSSVDSISGGAGNNYASSAAVLRSTSMRQLPADRLEGGNLYARHHNQQQQQQHYRTTKRENEIEDDFNDFNDDDDVDDDNDDDNLRGDAGGLRLERQLAGQQQLQQQLIATSESKVPNGRGCSIQTTDAGVHGYRRHQTVKRFPCNNNNNYNNSDGDSVTEEASSLENAQILAREVHRPLDYDAQHRLNESGLPETNSIDSRAHQYRDQHADKQQAPLTYAELAGRNHQGLRSGSHASPSSHLGFGSTSPLMSNGRSGIIGRYATTGRQASKGLPSSTISGGRAMSQQSLTRPMAGGRRLRRGGSGGGSNSGSDIGGSSVSLSSRLHSSSRYENAHTRTPVVMYIPQVTASKPGSMSDLTSRRGRASSRRATKTRPGYKSGVSSSQERRKSLSRDASDSEGHSSMLRTLVKRRSGTTSSRRSQLSGHEDEDNVGQLATEIDSYRFRRRYSVPKDAKINWFAKLRQRVISKN